MTRRLFSFILAFLTSLSSQANNLSPADATEISTVVSLLKSALNQPNRPDPAAALKPVLDRAIPAEARTSSLPAWQAFWHARATAALAAANEKQGRIAGHHLLRLGIRETNDPAMFPLLAKLHHKGWLAPYYTSATITSTPPGASVKQGERILGKTPLELGNLEPGSYEMNLDLPGYLHKKIVFQAVSGQKAAVSENLTKFDPILQNQTFTLPDLGLKMIWVNPGSVEGTVWEEYWDEPLFGDSTLKFRNKGKKTVAVSQGYFLGATEVTQAQWQLIMGSNPSHKQTGPDHPVEQVTWEDAMAFCKKLTARYESSGALPKGWAYTLPTETQWAYAARAGATTDYHSGNSEKDLAEVAWYYGNYLNEQGSVGWGGHRPVGSKKANSWGFYDMHGNVEEWCVDSPPFLTGSAIVMGGNYFSTREKCRIGLVLHGHKTLGNAFQGFRLALVGNN